MAVKTTGAEFKRFYSDAEFWPEGTWHDDTILKVDGVEWDSMTDYSAIPDASTVTIVCGVVIDSPLAGSDMIKLGTYFKKWHKTQSTVSMLIECDLSNLDAVKAAIKAAGGRVV